MTVAVFATLGLNGLADIVGLSLSALFVRGVGRNAPLCQLSLDVTGSGMAVTTRRAGRRLAGLFLQEFSPPSATQK